VLGGGTAGGVGVTEGMAGGGDAGGFGSGFVSGCTMVLVSVFADCFTSGAVLVFCVFWGLV